MSKTSSFAYLSTLAKDLDWKTSQKARYVPFFFKSRDIFWTNYWFFELKNFFHEQNEQNSFLHKNYTILKEATFWKTDLETSLS